MFLKQIKYGLVVLIACSFNLHADDIIVSRIPVSEHLPSNTVCLMFQDREGYIRLGTQNGFCRYDAYEMKSFRSEVSRPTFPSNFITGGFAEDTLSHTLWIGTEKCVLILGKRTCTDISPDTVLLGGAPVRQILYDADANEHLRFYVNERLLYSYNIAGGWFTDYTRDANIDKTRFIEAPENEANPILQRNPLQPEVRYEWLFEIKYCRTSAGDDEIAAKRSEGLEQLTQYLCSHRMKDRHGLKAALLVFTGKNKFEITEIE
jgi:hypothetical protein